MKGGKDIKTQGFVLKRTNYGEADRILNIITPLGKLSVLAKGVRKSKSKLAGSIEMFTLTDYVIHVGASELGILTGARMLNHYGEIVKDYGRLELMGEIMRLVNKYADSVGGEEYFGIVAQTMTALNAGVARELVEGWFLLRLAKAAGEEVNLYRDSSGEKLEAGIRYDWDGVENCFRRNENGMYGTDDIKLLRLMVANDLAVIRKVKLDEEMMVKDLGLIRVCARV